MNQTAHSRQISHYARDFESDHPRERSGKFSGKQNSDAEPGLLIGSGIHAALEEHTARGPVLGNTGKPNADLFLSSTLNAATRVEVRQPVGITATRAALKNARGEADGAIRLVELSWASEPATADAGTFSVIGPKDGRPLIVNVHSGFPRLHVESGNVVIMAESSAGHRLYIGNSANVTILCGRGRKVSSTTEAGGRTEVYLDRQGWGLHSANEDGEVILYGEDRSAGRETPQARTERLAQADVDLEAWFEKRGAPRT